MKMQFGGHDGPIIEVEGHDQLASHCPQRRAMRRRRESNMKNKKIAPTAYTNSPTHTAKIQQATSSDRCKIGELDVETDSKSLTVVFICDYISMYEVMSTVYPKFMLQ